MKKIQLKNAKRTSDVSGKKRQTLLEQFKKFFSMKYYMIVYEISYACTIIVYIYIHILDFYIYIELILDILSCNFEIISVKTCNESILKISYILELKFYCLSTIIKVI